MVSNARSRRDVTEIRRQDREAVRDNVLLANFFYVSLPWAKPISQQPLAIEKHATLEGAMRPV